SFLFFFFQAEDGIRDYKVTGVQTCALPISRPGGGTRLPPGRPPRNPTDGTLAGWTAALRATDSPARPGPRNARGRRLSAPRDPRSEERRVGKECRSRWSRAQ